MPKYVKNCIKLSGGDSKIPGMQFYLLLFLLVNWY
jgi:hypothetical protein